MQQAQFTLSDKQSLAWEYLHDHETTELLFGGAAGGGKSVLGCLWQLVRRMTYAGSRGVIARAELKTLKNSTLVTLINVAGQCGYVANQHYRYNSQSSSITFINGSTITLLDLKYVPSDPDYQELGSVEYTDAFIDEAGEVPERAVDILKSRLRYMVADLGILPKLLLCSNPADNWLKARYIKDKEGSPVKLPSNRKYIQSKLTDNPSPEFIKVYRQQLLSLNSEYDRARLLDGDWDARPRTGNEYYHCFNHDKHVSSGFDYRQELSVHISYDFNSHPYMPMLELQIELIDGVWHIYAIDEYCFEHPQNTTYHVTEAFKNRRSPYISALYYYGDYTGKNPNTAAMMNIRHNYDVVDLLLAQWINNNSDRVIPNQPVLIRKEFVLDILQEKLPLRLHIHERCKNLIKEMTFMREQPDGTKHVEMTKDELTGKKYEKYGHLTDALEYFLTSCFNEYYETYKRR